VGDLHAANRTTWIDGVGPGDARSTEFPATTISSERAGQIGRVESPRRFGWRIACSARSLPVDVRELGRDSMGRQPAPLDEGLFSSVQKRLGHTTERISPTTFRRERVSSLGRREPATVTSDSSLGSAIAAMGAGETRSVLVTDGGGRLVGVFTERDIVLQVLGQRADLDAPVSRYMTGNPDALRPDSPLGEALELMESRRYHGLPIVDDEGHVAGHLDSRDVLEYIAEAFPQEILNLPPRPHQRMDQPEGA
jgi:CBS domain-containing protein